MILSVSHFTPSQLHTTGASTQLAYRRQLLICNLCFAPFVPEGMHFAQYRKLANDARYGGTAHNA